MADDGETKDDVKVPEGEVGEKIEKLFRIEEKDTSKLAWRVEAPVC
jgi:translation initiation factor 5A